MVFSLAHLDPSEPLFAKKGKPKTASDLQGITYINVDSPKRERARLRLLAWARALGQQTEDPAITELILQREVLRRERDELSERLSFEQQKSRDLARIVSQTSEMDFEVYDLNGDGHWKLLFDYESFWYAVKLFTHGYESPEAWREFLDRVGLRRVTSRVSRDQDKNSERTALFVAKTLRFLRFYEHDRSTAEYLRLLSQLSAADRQSLDIVAAERAQHLSRDV
jgi:hypothetical protein